MKIDVYTLLPDKVKDYIAEEISEALAKNNIDNSAVTWDIDCNVLDIEEDLQMSDSFMHKHQAALDSQREEAAINWRFPKDDEEEIEDKDFPYEEENYD